MKSHRAFTLVELMLASAIFVVVLVAVYSSFRAGLFGYKDISANIEISQKAKLALERINTDLRNSFIFQSGDTKFFGSADTIGFLSLVDTYTADAFITNYAWVRYRVVDGALMRLCRKNELSLKDDASVAEQELASGVSEFSLVYLEYDSDTNTFNEYSSWTKLDKLPEAVKVRITFTGVSDNPFERTIFL